MSKYGFKEYMDRPMLGFDGNIGRALRATQAVMGTPQMAAAVSLGEAILGNKQKIANVRAHSLGQVSRGGTAVNRPGRRVPRKRQGGIQ